MVAAATDPATGGYWLVASDGGVFSFNAPFYGSAGALTLARPVVGAAATPDGGGYWLVASDGGIFAFGDAGFFGSEGGQHLNRPIVGMAATPTGRRLLAGGLGRRHLHLRRRRASSARPGAIRLNRPVVGMAATPTGDGYWLVASDGGIFTFGDAGFSGSTGSIRLNRPVVGMAATPTGAGYWLVASDGGIFTFGDAGFSGPPPACCSAARSAIADRRDRLPGALVRTAASTTSGAPPSTDRPTCPPWSVRWWPSTRDTTGATPATPPSSTSPSTTATAPSPVTPSEPRRRRATPSTPSTSTSGPVSRPCSRPRGPPWS